MTPERKSSRGFWRDGNQKDREQIPKNFDLIKKSVEKTVGLWYNKRKWRGEI
jgi:hypothetical protein